MSHSARRKEPQNASKARIDSNFGKKKRVRIINAEAR
jgi:hypothetical protein